jgi:MYXO-CTERM domain-containing protein
MLASWITHGVAQEGRAAAQTVHRDASARTPFPESPQPVTGPIPEQASTPPTSPSAAKATFRESNAATTYIIAPPPHGGCAGCTMAHDDDARTAGLAALLLGVLAVRRGRVTVRRT